MIGNRNIRCQLKDKDRYGRLACECFVGSINMNEWLVENGGGLAYRQYSSDYMDEEDQAKEARVRIWSSEFINPGEYRKGNRMSTQEAEVVTSDGAIKGNINRDGEKIYPVPEGKYYRQTKISTRKGERWFCSEKEALKAGWRKSFE